MGIKHLNHFLTDRCQTTSIEKIHLSELQNKTLVIDTSIYLYRYLGKNAIIESFYEMISIFRNYNITPLFIFDGKPPMEKSETLQNRKYSKKNAEEKYKELEKQLTLTKNSSNEKKEILLMMECIKKKFLRIQDNDIQRVKDLIHSYGAMYYVAEGEADCLCAQLVIQGKAWGCISDDMDMLVYGCPLVLRHLSLRNHTILQYHLDHILQDLDISLEMFRQMMVLYGTDYIQMEMCTLDEMMEFYQTYKQSGSKITPAGFYQWIQQNIPHSLSYDEVLRVYRIFCQTRDEWNMEISIQDTFDKKKLYALIEEDGFVCA
jgi:flap endonuclease-1